MFEDTDKISDEGFDDGGILWHGLDIPDNMSWVYMEIYALDDDNDGDYEIIDISSDEDEFRLKLVYEFNEDGPLSDSYSDDGSNDGNNELDAAIEISIHIIKGTSIEEVTPTSFELSVKEGESIHFEVERINLPPPCITIDQVYYDWLFAFPEDLENWYTLINEPERFNDNYDLFAQYGSEGEYYIACIVYTFVEGHDCYFWDYRVWDLTVVHNNTTPVADITVDHENINQFDSIAFSGWLSSDLDGDSLSYHWDFGDGTTAEEMDVTHTFINPGDYEVKLTVTDDENASNTTSVHITVNPLDLSGAEYWDTLGDGAVFTLVTDYNSTAQTRASKSVNIPLVWGYSLSVSASFVSETTVYHYGNVTYECLIDETKNSVRIDTELIEKDDYYEVYYRPYFEFNISIVNKYGEWDTLWSTEAPVPIESNVEGLDADGEPFLSIPVFGMGEIDIYTWDLPKKIYESPEPLMNHTGTLDLETEPITVVDVDLLKFLEAVTSFFPVVKFGIKILNYFVNLFLQGNLNVDVAIEDSIGLLTRTTGILEGDDELLLYDFSLPRQSQTVLGLSTETKMYGIMNTKVDSSISTSLDLYFNLTDSGQSIYGLWVSMNEKGFIAGIFDAVTNFFSLCSLPKEDYSFRKTLWESGEVLPMESQELYFSDYLSYSHNFVNEAPVITLTSPEDGAINEPLDTILTWDGTDGDDDALTYSVYLGAGSANNMILVADNITTESFNPTLNNGTTYLWKVSVNDGFETVTSETRSFTTGVGKENGPKEKDGDSPGFEIISLLAALCIVPVIKKGKKR
ncbi:MAG: PKD domain-containing protein [Thermoplasmata archaeon]|nr:PKD domain-containing protein [Thermoplasmata archaeon]